MIICLTVSLKAQNTEPIRFRKDQQIIFTQKGSKTDTLSKGRGDLFYLMIPDSLKEDVSIYTQNAQFMPTANDSIKKLNYIPGHNYESFYIRKLYENKKNPKPKPEFSTLVNGASLLGKDEIIIEIVNRKTGELIIKDHFYYRRD
jgi:hypothetical protein